MTDFRAAIFDWAGTVIDFGSFAPMGVFVKAFAEFGVEVTIDQARGPMGLPKRDHIKAMMEVPAIADQWRAVHGATPGDAEIDRVYDVFVPMNESCVADYAILVPGAKAAVDALRAQGLKIGSTTGYTRSIMERVTPVAAKQGFVPDNMVCADDVIEGRPGPLCMYKTFVDLGVYPPSAVLKIDDTEPGIAEGVAAGCVTVGVTLSGNYAGRTVEEIAAMSQAEKDELRRTIGDKLRAAGADHIIDTVADLPALVAELST